MAATVVVLAYGAAAPATEYDIDGLSNCVNDDQLMTTWIQVQLAAGDYTIELVESDFGSAPGSQNNLVCVYLSNVPLATDDYRFFILNGIGDAVTVTLDGDDAYVGFFDIDASDNHGSSTVQFSGPSAQLITADGVQNCTEPGVEGTFLEVDVAAGGSYCVELVDSDFSYHYGTRLSRLAYVLCDQPGAASSDYWVFSLNEIGDMHNVAMPGGSRFLLGFHDVYQPDNTGGSVLDIRETACPVKATSWTGIKWMFK
jgi:hypothetical protein